MLSKLHIHWWMAGISLLAASIAHGGEQSPDPTDASASVPAAEYRSAWPRYRTDQSPSVADWKQANRAVSKLQPGPATANSPSSPGHQHAPDNANKAPLSSHEHEHEHDHADRCPMMSQAVHPGCHHDQPSAMNCEGSQHDHH